MIVPRIAILTLLLAACVNAEPAEPIAIGSRLELFVDRYLIDNIKGDARLTLHEPRDEGIVVKFDNPWEGIHAHYSTVIHDGPVYRLYYRGLATSELLADKTRPQVTCYAESTDGIHWTKPNLGIATVNGSSENNIILNDPVFSHNFCPFVDANPNTTSDHRYKALAGSSKTGLIAYVSADGIHWKKLRNEPVIPWKEGDRGLDSQNLAFWSESEQCYVAYMRLTPDLPNEGYIRAVVRATSKDFLNWSDYEMMTYSDTGTTLPSVHLYTNQTSPYFRAPHIYLATAAAFMEGRRAVTDADAQASGMADLAFAEDCSNPILMTSRGGNHYDREFLEALIKPGIGVTNWTSRTNYPAENIVQTGETEMSIYLNQDVAFPTAHLRRYSMRLDGLASVRAGFAGGELVTKPLTFDGNQLILNVATSASGGVRVEIQDAAGKPIAGFSEADCNEVLGNAIEYPVTWKSGGDLRSLAGKTVRLRFVMKDADLYSFRFR